MPWETSGIQPRIPLTVTIDGVDFEGRIVKQIFQRYTNYQEKNGSRLLPGWEEKVWGALRDKYPRWVRKTSEKGRQGVSVPAAMSFIRFALKRGFDHSTVPVEEAERRASICLKCPKQENVLGCTKCKALLEEMVHPPQEVDVPEACGACLCYLKLKVWIPRHQLGKADEFPFWEGDETSPACWMR